MVPTPWAADRAPAPRSAAAPKSLQAAQSIETAASPLARSSATNASSGQWGVVIPLQSPDNPGKKIVRLKGSIDVLLQSRHQTVEFDNLAERNVSKPVANYRVVLSDIRSTKDRHEVVMTIPADKTAQIDRNQLRQSIPTDFRLIDAQGNMYGAGIPKTAANPNSAAYYLLAVAYYQQEDFNRALAPSRKAVELMDPAKPNESWLSMLSALYLQREEYKEAVPVLQQLIAAAPSKKTHWMQLSSVYGQMEDYPNALAIMQLANNVGLVTEDSEVRRLADLLLFNDVPYRVAQVLEAAIEKNLVKLDDKLYEKLANCWIAAGEFDKSVAPLQRAAELAPNGDTFIRLGEVQVQREDWAGAIAAVQRGVEKGQLKDPGNAQLMLGIAHYSQKEYAAARPYFERARQSDRHRQIAESYLQAIRAQS